jgi:hypothetical protein
MKNRLLQYYQYKIPDPDKKAKNLHYNFACDLGFDRIYGTSYREIYSP